MSLFKKSAPQTIDVAGHELNCPICRHNTFWQKRVQLNSSLATFFNLDWANRNATCFVCAECTHISWFLGKK